MENKSLVVVSISEIIPDGMKFCRVVIGRP